MEVESTLGTLLKRNATVFCWPKLSEQCLGERMSVADLRKSLGQPRHFSYGGNRCSCPWKSRSSGPPSCNSKFQQLSGQGGEIRCLKTDGSELDLWYKCRGQQVAICNLLCVLQCSKWMQVIATVHWFSVSDPMIFIGCRQYDLSVCKSLRLVFGRPEVQDSLLLNQLVAISLAKQRRSQQMAVIADCASSHFFVFVLMGWNGRRAFFSRFCWCGLVALEGEYLYNFGNYQHCGHWLSL